MMRPSLRLNFCTERSAAPPDELGADFACGVVAEALLNDEKFHSPPGVWISVTSGFSMVMPVTCRVLLKISGMISTPTLRDLAVRKADLLNFGSSAIERFL